MTSYTPNKTKTARINRKIEYDFAKSTAKDTKEDNCSKDGGAYAFIKKHYAVIFLFFLIVFHATVNWWWLSLDTAPPKWDQSGHLIESLKFYDIITHPSFDLLQRISSVSNYYPPLFQMSTTPLYLIFGKSADIAVMTNIIYLAILLLSIYGIGKTLYDKNVGLLSAFFISLYPAVYSMTRTYLLDFSLITMVSLSTYLLLKTNNFKNTKYSIYFGASLGLGMLTKWTFSFFIGPAILFILISTHLMEKRNVKLKNLIPFDSRTIRNIMVASTIGLIILSVWYVPNFSSFTEKLTKYSDYGVVEGDATLYTFESNAFYLFYLINSQVTVLMFVAFLIGCYFFVKRKDKWLLFSFFCILVPYAAFTLISNKDGRYTMPVVIFIALISAVGITKSNNKKLISFIVGIVFILGGIQLIHSTFGIEQIPPDKIIKLSNSESLRLYSKYTPETDNPKKEDWKNDELYEYIRDNIENKTKKVTVGIVPDYKYFAPAFRYYATLKNDSGLNFVSMSNRPDYLSNVYDFDYVITKTGDIGPSFTTKYKIRLNLEILNKSSEFNKYFYLIKTYNLPDNSRGEIYTRKKMAFGVLNGSFEIQNKGYVNYNNKIAFLGYDLTESEYKNMIRIVYYWKSLSPINESYRVFVHFLDTNGNIVFQQGHNAIYGIYPTDKWKPGELINEEYLVRIPSQVKKGKYYIRIGLYNDRGRLPVIIQEYVFLNQTPALSNKKLINYNNTFEFLGYDLNKTQIEQGDKFKITYYWKLLKKTNTNYTIFVHFLNESQAIGFQNNHEPSIPTSNWVEGQILKETQTVSVPNGANLGNYYIFTGLYTKDNGRLPVVSNVNAGELMNTDPKTDKIEHKLLGVYENKIAFLGYNLNNTVKSGELFKITYFWKFLDYVPKNYTVFVHFIDKNGKIIFQQDHEPVYGQRPTSMWNPGEIVVEEYRVTVPSSIPEGSYPIRIGLYEKKTGVRLQLSDGATSQIIGNVTVGKTAPTLEIINMSKETKQEILLETSDVIGIVEVK